MALMDLDAGGACSWALQVDGIQIRQVMEVSGLKMEQDVVELKQNTVDGKYVVKRLPGKRKPPGDVTCVRGVDADSSFQQWIKDSQFGKMSAARKNCAVELLDYEGTPIKRITLTNAWPKSIEYSALKAGDTNVLTEKLVITYEQMEVE